MTCIKWTTCPGLLMKVRCPGVKHYERKLQMHSSPCHTVSVSLTMLITSPPCHTVSLTMSAVYHQWMNNRQAARKRDLCKVTVTHRPFTDISRSKPKLKPVHRQQYYNNTTPSIISTINSQTNSIQYSNSMLIDCGFTSHSTQNRSFQRRSPSQSVGLVWKN